MAENDGDNHDDSDDIDKSPHAGLQHYLISLSCSPWAYADAHWAKLQIQPRARQHGCFIRPTCTGADPGGGHRGTCPPKPQVFFLL